MRCLNKRQILGQLWSESQVYIMVVTSVVIPYKQHIMIALWNFLSLSQLDIG